MSDIVNLNRARKKKAAVEKEKRAQENRTKFGRTKAENARDRMEKERAAKMLDWAKRDDEK
jgi:hypothetical protein